MRRRLKVLLGLAGLAILLLASAEIALAWTNPASTLSLGVSANDTIQTGHNLTIRLSLTNALLLPNPGRTPAAFPNLPAGLAFGNSAFFDYLLPVLPASCYGFPSGYIPAFVAIYNGSGDPQVLTDAPPNLFVSSCPAAVPTACECYWLAPFQTRTESISIGGFWHGADAKEPWINATYASFAPANYTIIAFDWWGHTAKQNFTVTG
jgi:hypothetical protein